PQPNPPSRKREIGETANRRPSRASTASPMATAPSSRKRSERLCPDSIGFSFQADCVSALQWYSPLRGATAAEAESSSTVAPSELLGNRHGRLTTWPRQAPKLW